MENPVVGRIFADSRMRRMLMHFAGKPRSVSKVAAIMGSDLKRTHYRVRRLHDLGLLRVVLSEARAGRAIKHYQAVGDSFFVPDDHLPEPSTEGLARELRERLGQTGEGGGLRMQLGPHGEPQARIIKRSERDLSFEMWRLLRLSAADQRELKDDLERLLLKYQQRPARKSGKTFLLHCAAAVRTEAIGDTDNPID